MGFIFEVVVAIVLVALALATTIAAFARMTLTLLNSHLTKIRPYVKEAASEPNKTSEQPILEQFGTKANSTAPTAQPFSNYGKQNITGLTNQTGYVQGNGNGAIKCASSKDLVAALNSIDDGKTQNGSPTAPPNYQPTPMPGKYYDNHGEQRITGLTNQTGFTEGDDNGTIDSCGD